MEVICSNNSCEQPVTYRTDFLDYCGAKCKLEDCLEDSIEEAPEHIYILRLAGNDSTWYYVGASSSVEQRLEVHMSDPPRPCWLDEQLSVQAVEEIQAVESGEEPPGGRNLSQSAREKEHHRALKLAIEKDTTNVLGGK